MGGCCDKKNLNDPNIPRCAHNEYPRNPAYANQPPALNTQFAQIPPPSGMGNMGGGGGAGFMDGAAMGYMMSGGNGMEMMGRVDGGPSIGMW